MFKLYLVILFLIPITIVSQTVSGKVYDAEATVKGAKIINITQAIMTFTDDEGNFKITAAINDSISFGSLFHEPKTLLVTQGHFNDVIVIELKKIVNQLDEVQVNKVNEKKLDLTEAENSLQAQIKSDVELRPWLYEPPPVLNMDFKAIGMLIAKLFKNKSKPKPTIMANYYDLEALFETDSFFNSKFLISELKIESQLHPLFFDFCEAKGIEKKLLLRENNLLLLETFIQFSDEFLEGIKD
ncbi:hypothetical protein ACS386_12465 [Flavobacteriaceae bacterium LMO-SS05]